MKKYLAILLAVLMALTLFACDKALSKDDSEPSKAPVDPATALKEAYEKTQLVKSQHTDMNCDIFIVMRMPSYSTEQNMEISYNISTDMQKDPSLIKMEGTLNAMGKTVDYLYYGEEIDGTMLAYASLDGGKTWTPEATDISGIADQANSLNSWILNAESAELVGTETVLGTETTVYTCQIPGSTFAQSNNMLSTLGAGIDASLIEDVKPVPATIWIDNETGLILRIRIDMVEYMRTIFERAMQEQMAEAGLSVDLDVQRASLDVTSSQFDSIAPIVIPEEAKATSAPDSGSLIGTWELFDGEGEESQQTVQMLLAFGMTMEMTFNEDGTGAISTSYSGETETEEFGYTVEGDQLSVDGDSMPYRIENGNLYISIDTDTLIFRRK